MTPNLAIALKLMGMGMLGIFIVMAAISLIVYGITKFSK
ncbi:MAG: sodium pump decarboxylase gamma subunit [Clostridia bacterium]|nr:sodium pump decarboxylase gamma subunit [Clostridia bacterium]